MDFLRGTTGIFSKPHRIKPPLKGAFNGGQHRGKHSWRLHTGGTMTPGQIGEPPPLGRIYTSAGAKIFPNQNTSSAYNTLLADKNTHFSKHIRAPFRRHTPFFGGLSPILSSLRTPQNGCGGTIPASKRASFQQGGSRQQPDDSLLDIHDRQHKHIRAAISAASLQSGHTHPVLRNKSPTPKLRSRGSENQSTARDPQAPRGAELSSRDRRPRDADS